jgi:hypothetical protein
MPTTKYTYYWHIHHEILCEPTCDIDERIKYIKKHKPKSEVHERLRLMTPVLHPEKLPLHFRKAAAACVKARDDYNKAFDAYEKTFANYFKALTTYEKARNAYTKACSVFPKALDTYFKALTTYAAQLEELHREEHPRCPWNGKTIFPK